MKPQGWTLLCVLAGCGALESGMPTVREMLLGVPAQGNLTIVGAEVVIIGTIPFVHVTTSDGLVGLGQASYGEDANESLAIATFFREEVATRALGLPAAYPPFVRERLIWDNYKTSGALLFRSVAGIDTALWDLAGKRAGKYVTELAGGVPGSLDVYGSSLDREITGAGLAAKVRRLMDSKGIRAFKIKIGQRMGNNTDVWPNRTAEVVTAVRGAVGPDVTLMADANGCWTSADKAWPAAQLLESQGYFWFEEPVVYWLYGEDVALIQRMRQAGMNLTVAAGEEEYREFLLQYGMRGGLDPIQPDVGYSGGFSAVLEAAQEAALVPTGIDLHSPNPSLNLVMTMHLTLAAPTRMPWMELACVDDGIPDLGQFFEAFRIRLQDGKVAFPAGGSGWGVSLSKRAKVLYRACVGSCGAW